MDFNDWPNPIREQSSMIIGSHCPVCIRAELQTSNTCEIQIIRVLDVSTTGIVFLVKVCSGHECVLKTMHHPELEHVRRSFDIHCSISELSSHVVTFWAAWHDKGSFSVLMEFCNGGNLRTALRTRNSEQYVQNFVVWPLLQVLVCMESKGIVHRDIKPENILIHQNQVRLGDFDLATCVQGNTVQAAGTPAYTAPEVLLTALTGGRVEDVTEPKASVTSCQDSKFTLNQTH